MAPRSFSIAVRVEYSDTDAMGIAHHASYLRWFERARVEWLRDQGLPYRKMESDGYFLPLMSAALEYKKPLQFDDEADLRLFLEDMGPCSVDIRYEVFFGGELATTGRTAHVLCKREVLADEGRVNWKPTRIPKEWRIRWELLKEKK